MFINILPGNLLMKEKQYLPVCVLICLFSKLGRSKALPQTSHGSIALSPLAVRTLSLDPGKTIVVSNKSPVLLAAEDDVRDSPETDLCSSSPPEIGEIGRNALDSKDNDKSNGDSVI